jgi:hypothetical protein
MKFSSLMAMKANDPSQYNLIAQLGSAAADIAYSASAKQMIQGVRSGIQYAVRKHAVDGSADMAATAISVLDGHIGKQIVAALLGVCVPTIPGLSDGVHVARLSAEFVRQAASIKDDDEGFNILFIGVYPNANGTPDRVSAFVSDTKNKMIECPIWEHVDFNDEDQIEKIVAVLEALIEKHQAVPLQARGLLPLAKCSKCKKDSAVMLWVEEKNGELEGRMRHACCACQKPGEYL